MAIGFQAESGLYQNWMRDYDPTTGRYLEADPLGLVDGASVYGYARGNPGRYVDQNGQAATEVLTTIGKSTIGTSPVGLAIGALGLALSPTPAGDMSASRLDFDDSGNLCRKGCPPCMTVSGRIVSVGTYGYLPLHMKAGHNVRGPHHNIFVAAQNPIDAKQPCRCQWVKQGYALSGLVPDSLPLGAVPVEPFVYRGPY